jgi:CelD/BcsL family acetyltransferase involved in cellulose biosynthesis
MDIRIIENIDDPFLKSEWERLEAEGNVFPQSTHHWCATWWRHLSASRKLHIVVAVDESERALAIAPLCIERHFRFPVLRSIPIHFGDFYTFITMPDGDSQNALDRIVAYIASNALWRWSRFEQVVESSGLAKAFDKRFFKRKTMTACPIADFSGLDWEEYLAKLRKGRRKNIRNRLRKLDATFTTSLGVCHTWDDYQDHFDGMVKMHGDRWAEDGTPQKSDQKLSCWKEAICGQFNKGTIAYYQLLLDGAPAAYRLGFLDRGTFYAWHTGFDPKYQEYHPGMMILAYMIKHFMDTGVSRINFMAGDYEWKLDWSPDRRMEVNYMFTSPSTSPISGFLNWYHHWLRDKLKTFYHSVMHFKMARILSRKIILMKRKLTGTR